VGPREIVAALCFTSGLAGLVGGVALDRSGVLPFDSPPHPRGERRHGPGGPGWGRGPGRLFDKLGLDAEQDKKIHAIFESRRGRFEQVMGEVRPKMQALREDTDREIRAVLTPEQAVKLDALKAEIAAMDSARQTDSPRDGREHRGGHWEPRDKDNREKKEKE
jgi:Spy/CpxP family protein refolding chaperone